MQEDTYERFGEIAAREGYLTKGQVEELLKEQDDSYILFGEALVSIGAVTEKELIRHLKDFNKLKLSGD
jgi:hypothetical protein